MRNIVLIGLSGCGKSRLGRMAARELGMPFADLDGDVENKAGMTIRRIFEQRGEAFFRELESEALKAAMAAGGPPAVVSTGGGIVLSAENVRVLRENGFVIFIDRPLENIAKAMRYDGRRPLLAGENSLRALSKERRNLYLRAADVTLQNDGDLFRGLAELLAAIRAEALPDGYAVIGDPIAHTLSPRIHGAVFGALGIAERYSAIHVPKGKLDIFVKKIPGSGLKGFNVTIPHKKDIFRHLDDIGEDARLCGAVNTVVVDDGRLLGRNTDMEGLSESLRESGRGCRGRKIVIIGSGGAAGSTAFMAAREGASKITILARNLKEAEKLAAGLKAIFPGVLVHAGEMEAAAMSEAACDADVLLNATPLGMEGSKENFRSFGFLKKLPARALVYDLVYKPGRTELLRKAAEIGLAVQNGLGMLIYQGILADQIFLGRKLDRYALYSVVKEEIKDDHRIKTGRD